MKTTRLFDDFPYETEFTAEVISCRENEDGTFDIVLDKTLFFPEEGGQSPDRGILTVCQTGNDLNDPASSEYICADVLDVQENAGGEIIHTVSAPLSEGTSVTGHIDWDHRFSNMQQHTGEHIFSGIINSRFGLDNVGFHLSDNEVTMDYNGALTPEDIRSAELAANEAIIRNIPVECRYPSPQELESIDYRSKKELEGAIRIVTIPGVDVCACCAPHVRLTGEVGLLKVISCQSHRGGVRVNILCGFRALEEFSLLQDAADIVSREYSVPVSPDAFRDALDKKNAAAMKLKQRISDLQSALLNEQIAGLDPEAQDVILFSEGLDEIIKRNMLNGLVTNRSGYCSIFDGNDDEGYSFIIASSALDCNEPVKKLREQFGARGGGKSMMVQGFVRAARSDIESLFL